MSGRADVRPIRVLLVDDDLMWLNVFSRLLATDENVDALTTAATLDQAYEALAWFNPTVIVTDLRLHAEDWQSSGIEFCRYVLRRSSDIGVIVVTGVSGLTVARELLRQGVFDIFEKSHVTPEGVQEAIHRAHISATGAGVLRSPRQGSS